MANPVTKALILGGLTEIVDLFAPDFSLWAIYATGTSEAVIVPDTVKSFAYRGEARISDYPIEQGAFASFNKVQIPYDIRAVLVCDGRKMDQGDFMTKLEQMKNSTDLFDIATPEVMYLKASLVHYDFRREARSGVTMITADCWFEEIREAATSTYTVSQTGVPNINSNSPAAATPQNAGTVTVTIPTPAQVAEYEAQGVY